MNARIPDHPAALQPASALARISQVWDEHILPPLTDYIRIPAKSPLFHIVPQKKRTQSIDTEASASVSSELHASVKNELSAQLAVFITTPSEQ